MGIFILCILAGVITFAMFKGSGSSSSTASITVWGTFPAVTLNKYVSDINSTLATQFSVKYVQKNPSTFSQDFVKALALGQGPDAILIPADTLLPQENKLTLIPYTAIPQRTFVDSFIPEASMYMTQNGLLAIPFTIDPMVMYWNRDVYNSAGVATYPRYWDEFTTGPAHGTSLVNKLTAKDNNGNIRRGALAMGNFSNITNAREILGTLMLQLGNPITTNSNGTIASTLDYTGSNSPAPAIQFYTQFIDPTNDSYTWNAGMPNDKTAFLSGNLATYFGFASEIAELKAKNPNLNFDVAAIPQVRTGGMKSAYGKMYGFSLVRASTKANDVFQIISILTSPQNLSQLATTMYLPPVNTSLIAQGSTDQYLTVFNNEALIAHSWIDVDTAQSSQILGTMVGNVTSGKSTLDQALRDAASTYNIVLNQATQ